MCKFVTLVQIFKSGSICKKTKLYKTPALPQPRCPRFASGAAALPLLLCPAAAAALWLGPPLCRNRSATAALPYKSTNSTLSNMEWLIVCKFVTLVQIFKSGSICKKAKILQDTGSCHFQIFAPVTNSHTISHSTFDNVKILLLYGRVAVAEQRQKQRQLPLCGPGHSSATPALPGGNRRFAAGAAAMPLPLCHHHSTIRKYKFNIVKYGMTVSV